MPLSPGASEAGLRDLLQGPRGPLTDRRGLLEVSDPAGPGVAACRAWGVRGVKLSILFCRKMHTRNPREREEKPLNAVVVVRFHTTSLSQSAVYIYNSESLPKAQAECAYSFGPGPWAPVPGPGVLHGMLLCC